MVAKVCSMNHALLISLGNRGSTQFREYGFLKPYFMYFRCPDCRVEFQLDEIAEVELEDEVEVEACTIPLGLAPIRGNSGNQSGDSGSLGNDHLSYRAHTNGGLANHPIGGEYNSTNGGCSGRLGCRAPFNILGCSCLPNLGSPAFWDHVHRVANKLDFTMVATSAGKWMYSSSTSPVTIGIVCLIGGVEWFIRVLEWLPIPPYTVRLFVWHMICTVALFFLVYRTVSAAYLLFKHGGVIADYNAAVHRVRLEYGQCDSVIGTSIEVLTSPILDRADVPLPLPDGGGPPVDVPNAEEEIMVRNFGKSRRHAWGQRAKMRQLKSLLAVRFPYQKYAHVMTSGGPVEKDSLFAQLVTQVERTMKEQGFCDGTIAANVQSIVAGLLTPNVEAMVAMSLAYGIEADIVRDYALRKQQRKVTGDIVRDVPLADFATLVRQGIPGPLRPRLG
jgi:hypothetical protein